MTGLDPASLTGLETDILRLVARGYNNPEISDQLGLPLHKVRYRLRYLCAKTGAGIGAEGVGLARARLVAYAYESGLMERPAPNPALNTELAKQLLAMARLIVTDQPLGALRKVAERAVQAAGAASK